MPTFSAQELLKRHDIEYINTRKGKYATTCPNCSTGYLNVEIKRDGVVWYCQHCKEGSGEKFEQSDHAGDLGPIKAIFDYENERGERLFQVLKFEPLNAPKTFRQRLGPEQEKWSIKGIRIVPFKLPELITELAEDKIIFIVEGEKDVLTLRKHGIPATCNPMGAGKWRAQWAVEFFNGANVIICGDNDQPGRDHVQDVARSLDGKAKQIRVLDLREYWPQIDESDDITDWFEDGGGTVERLWEIVDGLKNWQPGASNGHDQSTSALCQLPIRTYRPRPFHLLPIRPLMHAAHFFRRRVVMTVAPGGWGKTALDILNAVEMVLGVGLIGPAPVERPLRVLYWDGEDTEDEVERRLAAICIHYKLDREAFGDRLHLGSRLVDTHRFAEQDRYGKVTLNASMLSSLQQYIGDNKIDCTIFDPLIAFHQIKESDNLSMELLMKSGFERFSEKTNSCTELAQHTRKPSGIGELTVDDTRGAGATSNAARSVRLLNRMTKAEADTAKIEGEARRGYLRLTLDKVNYIPAQKARWIHLAGVELPNAIDGRPGDNVQVVESWGYPQPLDGVTTDDMYWTRDLVRKDNSYRKDLQSDAWLGHALAKRLKLDSKDKVDRAKLSTIIKAWLESSALATEERKDKDRKMREFIIPGPWNDEPADVDEQRSFF